MVGDAPCVVMLRQWGLLLRRKNSDSGAELYLSDIENELLKRAFVFKDCYGGKWFYEGRVNRKKIIIDNNFSDMIDEGDTIFTEVVRLDEESKTMTIFSRAVDGKMLNAGLEKLRVM